MHNLTLAQLGLYLNLVKEQAPLSGGDDCARDSTYDTGSNAPPITFPASLVALLDPCAHPLT
jgi:hypothetical protein